MSSHVRKENGDGNGFSGGLRLSWAALSVFIAAGGLALAVSNVVHSQSTRALERLDTRMTRRFDILDDRLRDTNEAFIAHCANPRAHGVK